MGRAHGGAHPGAASGAGAGGRVRDGAAALPRGAAHAGLPRDRLLGRGAGARRAGISRGLPQVTLSERRGGRAGRTTRGRGSTWWWSTRSRSTSRTWTTCCGCWRARPRRCGRAGGSSWATCAACRCWGRSTPRWSLPRAPDGSARRAAAGAGAAGDGGGAGAAARSGAVRGAAGADAAAGAGGGAGEAGRCGQRGDALPLRRRAAPRRRHRRRSGPGGRGSGAGRTRTGLRALAEGSASALLVRGVPDARVREHVRAYELVSAGGEATDAAAVRALAARDAGGIAPGGAVRSGRRAGARESRCAPARPARWTCSSIRPAASRTSPRRWMRSGRGRRYANDPQWGRRMRALVPALREAARARLPEYMVPAAFVVLEALPAHRQRQGGPRGAARARTRPARRGAYVAPRTPAEERLAGIWAEVLGVERVGGEDDFFDAGRPLAARHAAGLAGAGGVRGRAAAAGAVRGADAGGAGAAAWRRCGRRRSASRGAAAGAGAARRPPLPLSFAQQRLWFLDQLEPGSAAYNIPLALRLRGALDVAALRRALDAHRGAPRGAAHDLPRVDGEPVQRIAPVEESASGSWSTTSAPPAGRGGRSCAGWRARRRARPSTWQRGPLIRGRAGAAGGGRPRAAADDAPHRLRRLVDGRAAPRAGRAVRRLRARRARSAAAAAGAVRRLRRVAAALAGRARSLQRQAAYWRETLAGAPALLELPTDRAAPGAAGLRGRVAAGASWTRR